MNDRAGSKPEIGQAAEAEKLETLKQSRDALVDAGAIATSLWLSYIFVVLYLTIAVSGVTHRDLLLENPVKMPFLGVELPLIAFFWVAPLLFIIIHFYALLHFVLLSEKIETFHNDLLGAVPSGEERDRIRRRLPNNLFIQFLAGPRHVRAGSLGLSLRLIAWTTLVFAPVLLLMFFQVQLLPYHSNPTTLLQRISIIADLSIVWFLWRPIIRRTQRLVRPDSSTVYFSLSATILVLVISISLVTFPGDWLDRLPSCRCIPVTIPPKWKESDDWTSLHDLLFNGPVNLVNWRPNSPWSDRLVVPGIDIIDHSKFDKEEKFKDVRRTFSLRGRDLRGAVFNGADLRSVDFTGAQLARASFSGADLRRAIFGCDKRAINAGRSARSEIEPADRPGNYWKNLTCTDLTAVVLNEAKLDNAVLTGANLRGAILEGSSLVGAKLPGTNLTGASLAGADLTGSNLFAARLFGANLHSATLQGANLRDAKLSLANLDEANLQGANMELAEAKVSLLRRTQLQAVNMSSMNIYGAFLNGAHPWRTKPARTIPVELSGTEFADQPLTSEIYEALKQKIADGIDAKQQKAHALADIAALNPKQEGPSYVEDWRALAKLQNGNGQIDAAMQVAAEVIGCSKTEADDDPDFHFLLRGLIGRSGMFGKVGGLSQDYALAFAKKVLDHDHCKVYSRLTSDEKSDLADLLVGDDSKLAKNSKK